MNRFLQKKIAMLLLLISGWKLEGTIPALKKSVIIGAPHTSNWDFYFGMLYKMYYGINIHFLMKKELFRFPFGPLLKWIGGIPVDRSKHDNLVDRLSHTIAESDSFHLAIAPEGTRKLNRIWKRGFYHIAKKASVPIVMAYMDYRRKKVGVGPVLIPGDNISADMMTIVHFYEGIVPKYPSQFGLPCE